MARGGFWRKKKRSCLVINYERTREQVFLVLPLKHAVFIESK